MFLSLIQSLNCLHLCSDVNIWHLCLCPLQAATPEASCLQTRRPGRPRSTSSTITSLIWTRGPTRWWAASGAPRSAESWSEFSYPRRKSVIPDNWLNICLTYDLCVDVLYTLCAINSQSRFDTLTDPISDTALTHFLDTLIKTRQLFIWVFVFLSDWFKYAGTMKTLRHDTVRCYTTHILPSAECEEVDQHVSVRWDLHRAADWGLLRLRSTL